MTGDMTDRARELLFKVRGGLSYIDQSGIKIAYTYPRLSDDEVETFIASALQRERDEAAERGVAWCGLWLSEKEADRLRAAIRGDK